MDKWQEHVYWNCRSFVDTELEHIDNEVTISLVQREAYIVMKALEDQQRYLNPQMVIEANEDVHKL